MIGRGGMATVILATDHKHERRVAIKVLNTDASGQSAERFQREIKLLARLQHPNLLPVFDSGVADGRLWYSMPYVEGESLRARLSREPIIDADTCMSMLGVLADALSYAHSCGVIHRDIKPENILLSHSIPLIADFGIAAALDTTPDNKLTATGMAIGTPQYMSPEQAMGEGAVDARSDIYSLGCVGYEMLAGKPPFTGQNIRSIIAKVIASEPPSIRTLRPDVSADIDDVITKAISREPEDRWQTGSEFASAISAARTGMSVKRRRDIRPRLTMQRKIAALVILAVITAGSIYAVEKNDRRATPKSSSIRITDTAAVSALKRGNARVAQRTQRTFTEGLALIDEAIRIDSSYALAWAARAHAFNWARLWNFQIRGVPRDSLLSRALASSERALDLDSMDGDIWLESAVISRAIDPARRTLPIRAVRRAIVLDSMNDRAWQALGLDYQDIGQMDSATIFMRRAALLSRGTSGPAGYANHFYWKRQYDSAAVWSDSATRITARLPYSWEVAGATALMLHRLDDAENFYEAAMRLDEGPTQVRSLEGLAEVAAARGDTAGALRFIARAEKLVNRAEPNDHAAIALASAYASIGKTDAAIAWLERYHQRTDLHFQLHLKRDPQLDPLRDQRRFAALLVK